jgi:2'-phosphotransferase
MDKKATKRMSKALSWLLRHGGMKEGLEFTEFGYTNIDKLLESEPMTRCNMTMEKLKEIVTNSDKQRFRFSKDGLYIGATQGHSMKFTMDYKDIDSETVKHAIHGTYLKLWDSIKKEGLKTMSRTHIHFSKGIPSCKNLHDSLYEYTKSSVISGAHADCNVFIFLDIKKCLDDGIKLLLSENGVILTSGINDILPTKYFDKVLTKSGEKLDIPS